MKAAFIVSNRINGADRITVIVKTEPPLRYESGDLYIAERADTNAGASDQGIADDVQEFPAAAGQSPLFNDPAGPGCHLHFLAGLFMDIFLHGLPGHHSHDRAGPHSFPPLHCKIVLDRQMISITISPMLRFLKNFLQRDFPKFGALDILKYIGPGLLVTVGFIDPGNWASNVAAGTHYGYGILWVITLSTIMLMLLQHNAAHLGIATGLCLSEAATVHFRPWVSRLFLASAVGAAVSTALAEIFGAAIGLQMLFGLPLPLGAALTTAVAAYLLLSNNYRRIEKYIIGFVSLIGISFIFELSLIDIRWDEAAYGWIVPSIQEGSMPFIMSLLGAVVMPHNLYLHSEIIQSRQWNRESSDMITRQMKYEITDTIFAMSVGWAINSAMIIVAAALFHAGGVEVHDLAQAGDMLKPLLGNAAYLVFAVALVFAGLSSLITAGMAGGSIFSGFFNEPFDVTDRHTRTGILITLLGGLAIVFFLDNPFTALIGSQIVLSVQLPWTVFGLITLTSSKKVMGQYRNRVPARVMFIVIAVILSILNLLLFIDGIGLYKI